MKLSRSQKREGSFLLVYQSMLNDDTLGDIVEANIDAFEMLSDESVIKTAEEVLKYAAKADEIIDRLSPTRKVTRIAKIPLAVMRLALYEIDCLSEDEVPDKVAINEAIELCKKYDADAKFVSGVLGSHYRSGHGAE
jgi:N utilization substance protein B